MKEEYMNEKSTDAQEEIFGLPVNQKVMFSDHKDNYKKRIEKSQINLLKKTGYLKLFLQGNEKILRIGSGCSPMGFLEQMLMGWMIVYMKRALFVLTDKRILHIPTKSDFTYKNSIAQILYADCQDISVRGSTLRLKYKNGKKENFTYFTEAKKLKSLLSCGVISLTGEQSAYGKRTHLCPRCTAELEPGKYVCSKCELVFKSKDAGKKISWIYPGGGYFYTRHLFLGIGDAITEVILLVLVVNSFVDTVSGNGEAVFAFVVFGIILIFEKLTTVYETNHFVSEYIPRDKNIEPVSK
ncbi:MAG: hypothetical protein HY810_08440 [Candidatus Omnitrophica bacterium]|nr:hypothetical protein [Candidatus Omnitrophota bacterium]